MSGPASGLYAPLPSLWDDAHAAGLDEPGLLLYRSNLLGADLRITNFGGGNTSAKLFDHDPLTGAPVTVAVLEPVADWASPLSCTQMVIWSVPGIA